MKICQLGETIRISDLKELGLANASDFGMEARAAMATGAKSIIVDLSDTGFVDCGGLGALVALRNDASHCQSHVSVRVINPAPPVRRMLNLTRLDNLLDPAEALSGTIPQQAG